MKKKINKTRITKIALIFVLALIPLFLVARVVKSQDVVKLAAIPPRVEDFYADPGEAVTRQIKVRNMGDQVMSFKAKIVDFVVQNKEGTPLFLTEDIDEHENQWAMSGWTSVTPNQFTLKPGETKVMDAVILVPDDALAGGHYAAVIYEPDEESVIGGSGAKITPSVATLLYLIVSGDITEDAFVSRMDVPKFSEFGPIDIATEIENLSDIHIKPQASIKIYNLFNRLSTTLKLDENNIFPNRARIYKNTWDKKWLFGRFKAQLEGSYGTTGQALLATVYFWVIPWRLILVVLLIIVLITLLTAYFKRKRKVELPPTPIKKQSQEEL